MTRNRSSAVEIRNRARLASTPARETALDCITAGIEAALPEHVIRRSVAVSDGIFQVGQETYDLDEFEWVVVLGGGKAAAAVARALETVLGDRLDEGVVVAHRAEESTDRVEVIEAAHPVPDERGLDGAERVLELARKADEQTLVLAIVTGGASALHPAPVGELALADLQGVTEELLDAGAAIGELNAVRSHCSEIKGGRLAHAATPATVVGLVFSDVVGDDLSTIGSGPTAPDQSTFEDALAVLDSYQVSAPAVRRHLEAGCVGKEEESPGPDDPAFERVSHHLLANAHTALDAAREVAIERGYEPLVLSSRIRGESREAALSHVAVAEEILETNQPVAPPAVILSGGETTVTVTGDGRGGPNQEFGLAAAIEFAGWEERDTVGESVVLASVDTDGMDGSTDAAGTVVDEKTVEDVECARGALSRNDAYAFLDQRDTLVFTGPTGTNVNDLRVVVVERAQTDGSR